MVKETITTRPWLDPSEEAKFAKGNPGETSDRWTAKPNIAPCWKGDYQEWHIEDGTSYQNQLLCKFWGKFINPSGFTCALCKSLDWPETERFRHKMLPGKDAKAQGDALVAAVEQGRLTPEQAKELARDFKLE